MSEQSKGYFLKISEQNLNNIIEKYNEIQVNSYEMIKASSLIPSLGGVNDCLPRISLHNMNRNQILLPFAIFHKCILIADGQFQCNLVVL